MARALVASLLLIRLFDESTTFLAPGHLERFHDDLTISYGSLGIMLAMPAIGGLLSNVFLARSDGTTRKNVVVGGTFLLAFSMFVTAAAGGIVMLCAGAFCLGIGASCMVAGGEMALAGATDGPLEHTLARVNLGGTVGDIAAPLAIAATRWLGIEWRWLFLGAGALVAVYAWQLAHQTFPRPIEPAPVVDDHPPTPILRHRAVWWIGVAAFISSPLDEAFLATVLAFAQERRSIPASTVMLLGAGFVAGGLIVFTVLVGQIEARDASAILMVCALTMALSTGAVLVVPASAIVLVGLVHSASLNAQWLSLQAAALRVAPGREGKASALIDTIEIASVAIPIAFGVVADRFGLEWSIGCFAALALLLVLPARGLRAARR